MKRRVLVVDDEPRIRTLYAQVLGAAGFETQEAGSSEEAGPMIDAAVPDLVVSDVRMPGASGLELLGAVRARHPGLPFLLVTAYADVRDAVAALKHGAVDYLAKPVDLDELVASVQDALGVRAGEPLEEVPPALLEGIVAESPAMRAVFQDAVRVARSDANVLLTGESGTGKEVLARFIHRASARAAGPLVAFNCAAVPGTLLAGELFGHERGAFTGAIARRDGRFREARGGTLFLDEIGELPLDLQPLLLRAIEQRVVSPLGATGDVPVDFRLVAATNRPLEDEVAAGRFRGDLYYRLNVITLRLPPLRERPEDVAPLARRFLAGKDGPGPRLSHAALRALTAYAWPGNVRELANAMERARLLTRTDVVLPEVLPSAVRALDPGDTATPGAPAADGRLPTLEESEVASIRRALAATDGNRTRAAEVLGITRRGLLKKLKRFGL